MHIDCNLSFIISAISINLCSACIDSTVLQWHIPDCKAFCFFQGIPGITSCQKNYLKIWTPITVSVTINFLASHILQPNLQNAIHANLIGTCSNTGQPVDKKKACALRLNRQATALYINATAFQLSSINRYSQTKDKYQVSSITIHMTMVVWTQIDN